MKKFFLIAAIGATGMVSAKSAVVNNTTKESTKESKKETSKTTAAACAPVTYSCGVKGWACGSTTVEMIQNVLDGESLFCG